MMSKLHGVEEPHGINMKFNLKYVGADGSCDKTKLKKVEHELVAEDYEFYDKNGWEYFRPENHIEYFLPSLGESIWTNESNVVLEIKGKRYKVSFEFDYDEPWHNRNQKLFLEPTDEPVSQFETKTNSRGKYWYKFFGQPTWVQNEHYPLDLLGNPCYHFVTIENGWGDSGNFNILLGFDENDIPNVAYFEASCC